MVCYEPARSGFHGALCLWRPAAKETAGDGKVTIYGGYGEAQAAAFQKALTEFGQANDIEITFTSLATFDTDIKVKIEAGQEPDIAMWPRARWFEEPR